MKSMLMFLTAHIVDQIVDVYIYLRLELSTRIVLFHVRQTNLKIHILFSYLCFF